MVYIKNESLFTLPFYIYSFIKGYILTNMQLYELYRAKYAKSLL